MVDSKKGDSSDIRNNSLREAIFYKQEGNKLRCELCPRECLIGEGKQGICKIRINKNGKLYTIAYGNLCARNVDPIEKKPLYHFLPASKAYSIAIEGCNFTCLNCQNWNISQSIPDIQNINNFLPEQIVEDCIKNQCKSIAYTYTEPICSYEYVLDTARIAKEKGIKNILISNGYINEKPLRNLTPYLDAANIDLKSFSNEIYKKICGGTLQPVLDTLLILKEQNVWLEVTYLLIPEINEDLEMIEEMCNWLVKNNFQENPLHFSKFVPLYKLSHLKTTSLNILEKVAQIALKAGIKYIYLGNVPGHEAENTFCPNCKKILIERTGYHILKNFIKNNTCGFCNEKISGVWGKQ